MRDSLEDGFKLQSNSYSRANGNGNGNISSILDQLGEVESDLHMMYTEAPVKFNDVKNIISKVQEKLV